MSDYYKAALDELRSDLDVVESELKNAELRHSQLQAAIALFEDKIQAAGEHSKRAQVTPQVRDEAGDYAMMAMPQAVLHCLSRSQKPLSKQEIMAMLRDGGKQEGKHFPQAVYNALYRMSRNGSQVRREDDGRWVSLGESLGVGRSDSLLMKG